MFVYIYTYIYIYTRTYIYICVCRYEDRWSASTPSPQSVRRCCEI